MNPAPLIMELGNRQIVRVRVNIVEHPWHAGRKLFTNNVCLIVPTTPAGHN